MAVTRKELLGGGAIAGVAALGVAPVAHAHGGDEDIVGSWNGLITATDPPLGSFGNLISFHTDGVLTESRRLYVPVTPLGPLLETTGHGAWKRTGSRSYEAFFRFLLQQAPPSAGEPIGTDNIRLKLRLDRGGDRFTGTFESNIRDNAGAIVFTARGTISGDRIEV
ncbi:MAG TPA: hypothetical protein VFX80_01630 [Solirubrobacteraceae bacterium]|nr:hypothetical protein [Solirubrobacteraceae bacterium]